MAMPAMPRPRFSSLRSGCIWLSSSTRGSALESSYTPSLGSTMKMVTREPIAVIMKVETIMKYQFAVA